MGVVGVLGVVGEKAVFVGVVGLLARKGRSIHRMDRLTIRWFAMSLATGVCDCL